MTIIKQRGVTAKGHSENLENYINGKDALLRGSHMIDLDNWATMMEMTRIAYGHDKVRKGKNGKQAKNTILFHQVIGFLPDECDVNNGELDLEKCEEFVKEWIEKYYPNQQVVYAIHREHCDEDCTDRYAAHLVINRTDLLSGKKLTEGYGKQAKVKRASRMREMDDKWNLHQVIEGEQNSKIHCLKKSQVETFLSSRNKSSWRKDLREICKKLKRQATSMDDYIDKIEAEGFKTEIRKGRLYIKAIDPQDGSYGHNAVIAENLDWELTTDSLVSCFLDNEKAERKEAEKKFEKEYSALSTYSDRKNLFLDYVSNAYDEYYKVANDAIKAGITIDKALSIPKIPVEMSNDSEVLGAVLNAKRRKDKLEQKTTGHIVETKRSSGVSQADQKRISEVREKTREVRHKDR